MRAPHWKQRQPNQQGLRVVVGEQHDAVTVGNAPETENRLPDDRYACPAAVQLSVSSSKRSAGLSAPGAPVPPRPIGKTHRNGSSAPTSRPHGKVLQATGESAGACIRFRIGPGTVSALTMQRCAPAASGRGWIRWMN